MNENYFMYFPKNREESFFNKYISFIRDKEKMQNSNFEISVLHHIVPRSFLPREWRNNYQADIDNLIRISPYDHLLAHELLYKAFPHTSMSQALQLMINDNSRYNIDISHISEKEYNEIEKNCRESQSKSLKKFYEENKEIHERLSKQRKGKIFIHNNEIERLVDPEVAKSEVNSGKWFYGMIKGRKKSDHMRERLSKTTQGRYKGYKYIFNIKDPSISKRMPESNAEKYIETGDWAYGRGSIKTNKNTSHLRNPEIIKKAAETKKTLVAINNGQRMKRIKPEKLQDWLNKGWSLGSYVSEETRQKIKEVNLKINHIWTEESKINIRKANSARKGFKAVHKESVMKKINPNEVDEYLKKGWELGGLKRINK